MRDGTDGSVRRRRVFYIPGYDPFPPRRYRELYRSEAAAQARISGHEIAVSPGPDTLRSWRVQAQIGGERVDAEVEVLIWADLVRASMGQGIVATYVRLVRTAWTYIAPGTLGRVFRLRKGPTIAALYPFIVLLGGLALAVAAGTGAGTLAHGALARLDPGVAAAAGLATGVAVTAGLLVLLRRLDRWTYAFYLLNDYAHTAQAGGAYPADLEERLSRFRATVAAALVGPWDEVLVVGHSSGAHLAVSMLADLIRAGGAGSGVPALSLLTLGHVVPMVSFLPRATRLRADLAYVSARPELTWVDVTAPGDGCSFALCDPVAVTGVAPPDKRWPLVLSAAFTQTLSPGRWKALRWRFFRLHFQYLCAFDRPGDYDYFAITAGPLTLARRYAGRLPSRQRVETPMSRFRSVA